MHSLINGQWGVMKHYIIETARNDSKGQPSAHVFLNSQSILRNWMPLDPSKSYMRFETWFHSIV